MPFIEIKMLFTFDANLSLYKTLLSDRSLIFIDLQMSLLVGGVNKFPFEL